MIDLSRDSLVDKNDKYGLGFRKFDISQRSQQCILKIIAFLIVEGLKEKTAELQCNNELYFNYRK